MPHSRILLRDLPAFYQEMAFLSYQVTEHQIEHDQCRIYITVSGMHPDYHLVTIVQTFNRADIISEHEIDYEGEYDDPEMDEPTTTAEDMAIVEALGSVAFDLAFAKATEAGVIRPAIIGGLAR